jgi:adenylate cyclase
VDFLLRGDTAHSLRLASGIVLFGFTLLHLVNHALGLISLDAMLAVQYWRVLVTRSWPGMVLLGGSLVVHIALSAAKIARRTTWRMEPTEAFLTGLGLLIPFLLLPHIIDTHGAASLLGIRDTYLYVLALTWPSAALTQTLLVAMVWVHGCAGIRSWLAVDPRFKRYETLLLVLAAILPLAALVGYLTAGREVASLAAVPGGLEQITALTGWPEAADALRLERWRATSRWLSLLALCGLAAANAYAIYRAQSGPRITISYVGGPVVATPIGPTLLEISRAHGIAHAAICGGRSRCSTCRVRIDQGLSKLPPPDVSEQATLKSIDAPPNVRLACQIRPKSNLVVARLLRGVTATAAALDASDAEQGGVERILVLMFLDVRNFTRHMEQKLPYDVVYLLNEFFAATGRAITSNGGVIDKFLGDGLLAVFGRTNGPEDGCRQALQAARAIDLALDHFNARLESELVEPIRVGIGIHAGPLLLGRIGWGEAVDMTVIGHTVNAASRLEALTKQKNCQLVISREVADFAGWTEARGSGERIEVRGVAKPIEIIAVTRGRDLPPQILGPGWSG